MIKILTLLGNNYGGCLQAYALQHKIEELGYECKIINYSEYLDTKITIKGLIKNIIYLKRNKKINNFKNKNFKLTRKYKTLEDDGSIYIVGSDQVWNPSIDFSYRKRFYLDFVKEEKRKNSYAASIGNSILDTNKNNICHIKEYLNNFNNISVREDSSIILFKNLVNKNVVSVVDPTFLLNKGEWYNMCDKKKSDKYILVYTLGLENKYINIIDDLCAKKKIKIRDIFYKKRFKYLDKKLNNLGPSEWISSVASSEFVITNSFHGTVFSIIFHKEFIVITRDTMNNRIYDLLENLGIEGRIYNYDELKNVGSLDDIPKINYKDVDLKLKKLISDSERFLNKILEEENN